MKNLLTNKVSCYRDVTDTTGQAVELLKFLTTDKWKSLSYAVRSEPDKEKRAELKKCLPLITPSGLFRERKASELIQHSGLICLDIDGQDNPTIQDFEQLKNRMANIAEVAFAAISASGSGLFVLIPILYPSEHKRQFQALQRVFFERYGIRLDVSCSDVCRARFYSYDPHPFINPEAGLFKEIEPAPTYKRSTNPKGDTDERVSQCIDQIISSGLDIVPTYLDWFTVGCSLTEILNGRDYFHAISSVNSAKYNQARCDKQFDHCTRLTGSIGHFFNICKQYGIIYN